MQIKLLETVVFFIYMAICLGVGAWFSKRAGESQTEYLVAGRKIGLHVTAVTNLAGIISGTSFLSLAAYSYTYGISYALLFGTGATMGYSLSMVLMAEQVRRAKPLTFPSFLGQLYQSKAVHVIGGILYVIVCVTYLVPPNSREPLWSSNISLACPISGVYSLPVW